jgi:hypothetical protein
MLSKTIHLSYCLILLIILCSVIVCCVAVYLLSVPLLCFYCLDVGVAGWGRSFFPRTINPHHFSFIPVRGSLVYSCVFVGVYVVCVVVYVFVVCLLWLFYYVLLWCVCL